MRLKSTVMKTKNICCTTPKLKTFILKTTPSRKWVDNIQIERKYLKIIYPIKDLLPEHIKYT